MVMLLKGLSKRYKITINILKEIDIKISTFSEIETEIYPSEDETLH